MTYTPVGLIAGAGNGGSGIPTATISPNAVGNYVLATVATTASNTITGMSGANITWAPFTANFVGSTHVWTTRTFLGLVTSTLAQNNSPTFSSTPAVFAGFSYIEFSSTTGAPVLDHEAHLDSSGTATWPNIPATGSAELYWGYALDNTSAVQGNTSGYTYNASADNSGNGAAYNQNVGPGTVTGPTWGDAGQAFGDMVVIMPAPSGGAGPQRKPLTWQRRFLHPQTWAQPPPPVAAAGVAGQQQPWATVPVPRLRLLRAFSAGIKGAARVAVPAPPQPPYVPPRRRPARGASAGARGQAFVQVPAPPQPPYLPPRRQLARGQWRGSPPFTGFVAVPAPRQIPPVPRRRLARAIEAGSRPVTGFVAVPAPPQPPYLPPRRQLARGQWRGGAVPGIIPVPPRQPPYLPPRRVLARAVLGFPAEGAIPPFVPVPAPPQLPAYPRRVPARAHIRFTPVPGSTLIRIQPEAAPHAVADDKGFLKKIWMLLGD